MNRQRVHLAADFATAVIVGIRRANPPVILEVRAAEAAEAGVRFWIGNDSIWLANFVPAEFLRASTES
jgi:putative RNA 2'-phosphotransferase